MIDSNGQPRLLAIDKGGQKINVGSKLSDFNIVRNLGEGHFGSVKLVTSKLTNKLYAMKEIQLSRYQTEKQRQLVEKEIKLLENLHHPNVITYFNSFKENGNFYIIIEYINGGSLEDLLVDNIKKGKRIDERTIWDLLVQSLSGLLYLHEKKRIIHRDIKPDNLLLDSEGRLKISDFGVSAIISEEVDDNLKCHNTVAGPIQFMSPEVALGDIYDFKSDIYMLGLTFFFMMSNRLPEKKITFGPLIIPVRNPNAKLPEEYSVLLRDFVENLLKESAEQRPSTSKAYYEALSYYTLRYLKSTSICSTLLCLFSISRINKYFKGDSINKLLLSDEENGTENYIITRTFKEAFYTVDPSIFNPEKVRLECLKLRLLLYIDKERMNQSDELELYGFVGHLLLKLHTELNKFKGDPQRESIKLDESTEQNAIMTATKKFITEYKSKISDEFYYLSKVKEECPFCNSPIRYFCGINSLCAMYPDRTAIHFKRKDINIIDMFRHYKKTRLFTDTQSFCKKCNKNIDKINRTKAFYTSPFNFILEISYSKENFNLKIEEKINIKEFVERTDISKVDYILVGAIFLEVDNNEEKYASISRYNGGWVYYNGKTIQNSNFNSLLNHKHVKMLFYSGNSK